MSMVRRGDNREDVWNYFVVSTRAHTHLCLKCTSPGPVYGQSFINFVSGCKLLRAVPRWNCCHHLLLPTINISLLAPNLSHTETELL